MKDLFWQYKGLIEFMSENPGMYGLDNKRAELHKKLEKLFFGKEKELAIVLHDLPSDFQPADLCWAVNDIPKFKLFLINPQKALEVKDG